MTAAVGRTPAIRRFALYRQRSPDEEPGLIGAWNDLNGPLDWLRFHAPQKSLCEGDKGRLEMYEIFDWLDGSTWYDYAHITEIF